MILEKVFSPIRDRNIRKSQTYLNNSPIWGTCFKEEEIQKGIINTYGKLYIYYIKFEGTKPVQVTNVRTVKNR